MNKYIYSTDFSKRDLKYLLSEIGGGFGIVFCAVCLVILILV